MSRIAYVNGRYVTHNAAGVHVEDRGYQFADGVYEVFTIARGRLVDAPAHHDRLLRSLGELGIATPMAPRALDVVLHEVIRRNRLQRGIVYLQVTRGVSPRNHAFPDDVAPSLVITARRGGRPSAENRDNGVTVITVPDIRWGRCDIKSISLLPNILAKQAAKIANAYEAWQVDGDGMVTEGASSNAWIVDTDGNLVTRPLANAILGGITRLVLMQLAEEQGIRVIERPFSVEEAMAAREAFVTSATSFVTPVVQIDDRVIANGKPGSTTTRLIDLYDNHIQNAQLTKT
ncbi:MAG: D-amino-acid transaminase [Alphaproteobacteria bacterium]|nr:D-amino-acid transaminase [Alphaproteobacteria bacterium]